MTNFHVGDIMTFQMSLDNIMYFCIMAGIAPTVVMYLWVYEPTSEMHGVNIISVGNNDIK